MIHLKSINVFSLDELFFEEFVVFARKGESHRWSGFVEVAVLGVFACNTDIVSVSLFESIIESGYLIFGSSKFENGEDLA